MDNFLAKHLLLANKNLIITIHYGENIDKNIFNIKLSKEQINELIKNVATNYKYKINHTSSIHKYKIDNTVISRINNNIEYEIQNTTDTLSHECLFLKVTEIQKDSMIPESTENCHSSETYDLMTITINNTVELHVCDYSEYYTAYISLKKPVSCSILKDILIKIFHVS